MSYNYPIVFNELGVYQIDVACWGTDIWKASILLEHTQLGGGFYK